MHGLSMCSSRWISLELLMEAEKVDEGIAAALEAERVRQGFSMNKLAESAGLSQQMVSYVERGMRNPTLETLLRMCGVLKLNLGEVIKKAIRDESRG